MDASGVLKQVSTFFWREKGMDANRHIIHSIKDFSSGFMFPDNATSTFTFFLSSFQNIFLKKK